MLQNQSVIYRNGLLEEIASMIGNLVKKIPANGTRKFRLRTTLVVPFVFQIAAAVGLVGYLSFRNGQKAVDDLANQLNGEISARIEQHVIRYLNKSQDTLWLTRAGIQSDNFDLQDIDRLRRYFWQVVHTGEFESYLSYGNEQGEFLGVEYQDDGEVQLKLVTPERVPMRETYALDSQGEPKKLLKTANYDPRSRPWYKAAVEANKPTWSKIYPFFSSKNTVLGISPVDPISDANGNRLGVLCINVRLTQITDFINHLKISSHGQSFIMERSGELVASSTIPQPFRVIGTGEKREVERISASKSDNPVVKATGQQLLAQFGDLNTIQKSQSLKFKMDNGSWYYAQVLPIQDGRGIDWLTVVVVPETDFMAQIYQNTNNTIGLCLIALLVAIAIGFYTSRWVTSPILRVSQAANQLAQGDLDQQVQPSPIVEIEMLADSFNHMAGQLKASFESLEANNEALRIAEENYRSIFENAIEGIFQASSDGRFINVNLSLAKIYGYDSPAEMMASITNIDEQIFVDPEKQAEFRQLLIIQGLVKEFEYRSYCKDSSIIWTQSDTRAIQDNNGKILYYEGSVQDISDRKRRETELRRQLEELRIEIDQKKREKEVAMLTESNYFKEVKQEISKVNLDEFWG
jgi:adenylate cyclase